MKVNYFTSYFTLLYFVGFLVSTAHLQAQSQISFRQLSVKEGLSQNSAIAIGQDSTGYLYVATQDGLNKYDGRSFEVFPYNFIDVTKPDYSHLGKVYRDRQENLWIIPIDGIPRKLNYKTGNEIFIVRPNQRRFWTQSMAIEDASELILEILNEV